MYLYSYLPIINILIKSLPCLSSSVFTCYFWDEWLTFLVIARILDSGNHNIDEHDYSFPLEIFLLWGSRNEKDTATYTMEHCTCFSVKSLFKRTTQEARTDCLTKVSKSGAFQNANVLKNQEGFQDQVLILLMSVLPLFNILRGWWETTSG